MAEQQQIAALKNVSLTYPAGNSALSGITLNLFSSDILGIAGANGSGKTTLLKLIAGYITATSGQIDLEKNPIEEFNDRMLNDFLTFIEQSPENQLTGPTVEDELARTCRLMGLKGRDIQVSVTRILEKMNMEHTREWFIDEISTGEKRRVALGLALLRIPKLLLLDEPFIDLDDKGLKTVMSFIKKYQDEGVSIIICSLRFDLLLKIANRVGVIHKGQLKIVNQPDQVMRNHKVLQDAGLSRPDLVDLCLKMEAGGLIPAMKTCPSNSEEAMALLTAAMK